MTFLWPQITRKFLVFVSSEDPLAKKLIIDQFFEDEIKIWENTEVSQNDTSVGTVTSMGV